MAKIMYSGVSKNDFFGALKMVGPFPLNINTVQISLNDLKNYIKNDKSAYPGMLIAIDDDKTSENVNVETTSEKGIYYITQENGVLKQYKLAYEKDLDNTETNFSEKLTQLENSLNSTISNSVDPLVKILNTMLADYCPWDEIYDEQGRETGSNPVVTINNIQVQAINGRIYQITPIYDANQS